MGTQVSLGRSRFGLTLFCVLYGTTLAVLLGCGLTGSNGSIQAPGSISGTVQGGLKPVAGASVQLYATGTKGVGSPAQPLLETPSRSDSNGNFSIAPSYRCPSASSQL